MAEPVLQLIDRLETATSGQYVLDRAIWEVVCPPEYLHADDRPPPYTVSLDAALRLVPKGAWWSVQHLPNPHTEETRAAASVTIEGAHAFEKAATPALALCIAALKAQQAASPALPEAPEPT